MHINTVIAKFFFLVLAYSICLNPSEVDGKCSGCLATSMLNNGTCIPKIRGCVKQSGESCLGCDKGYVLFKDMCVADLGMGNDLKGSAVLIKPDNAQTLNYKDIISKVGQLYGSYFAQVDSYFREKYLLLDNSTIGTVNRLQTRKGVYFVAEYQTVTQSKYQLVAYIDKNWNEITQWSFLPLEKKGYDPIAIDKLMRSNLGDKIKNLLIYQITKYDDNYTIDYMANITNDVTRVTVYIKDLASSNLSNKLVVKNVSFADLAQEKFLAQNPEYKNFSNSAVFTMYNGMDVLKFGSFMSVSFHFDRDEFVFNTPYEYPQSTSNVVPSTAIGGFTAVTNLSDPSLQDSFNTVLQLFPDLSGSKLIKAQSQVVSGTNYLMDLQKASDLYQVRVWYTLQQVVNLIEVKKNGAVVYINHYDYNSDADFLNNYLDTVSKSNVVDILPIQSVLFNMTGTRKYYKVNYDDSSYSEFEYQTSSKKANLLSYTLDGQNILVTLMDATKTASQRSPSFLLTFLQSKKPISNRSLIEEINVTLPTYEIKVATENGEYLAVIADNGGSLNLTQFSQISNSTCYEIDKMNVKNRDKINTINNFLLINYPLQGYNVQLVQVSIGPSSYLYRFLYSNALQKQIEIYLEENDGIANVTKASYINFGYQKVEPVLNNSDYSKILSALKSINLNGTKIPIYTQSNDSTIKSFVDDGKSTIQVYYDRKTTKLSSQIVASRSYSLVPTGFDLATLLVPGVVSAAVNTTLANIYQLAVKKYSSSVNDVSLLFAQRLNNTYTLLYKNMLGYQQLDAVVDNNGVVTLGKLVLTSYDDSCFSNCKQYGSDGKCLTCNSKTQIEYQGYCWNILEGCEVQMGGICAKCKPDYAKSNQKCYKQCTYFFR